MCAGKVCCCQFGPALVELQLQSFQQHQRGLPVQQSYTLHTCTTEALLMKYRVRGHSSKGDGGVGTSPNSQSRPCSQVRGYNRIQIVDSSSRWTALWVTHCAGALCYGALFKRVVLGYNQCGENAALFNIKCCSDQIKRNTKY